MELNTTNIIDLVVLLLCMIPLAGAYILFSKKDLDRMCLVPGISYVFIIIIFIVTRFLPELGNNFANYSMLNITGGAMLLNIINFFILLKNQNKGAYKATYIMMYTNIAVMALNFFAILLIMALIHTAG